MRVAAIFAALLAATAAVAQDNGTTTIPAPAIERYNLPPGNSQATPAPTPTPVPAVLPTPQPTAVATPAPARPAPAASRTPRPTPTPTPSAASVPIAEPTPVATQPTPAPPPVTPPPATSVSDNDPSLWWAIGGVLFAVAGAFAWRRFAARPTGTIADAPEAAAPLSTPAPRPVAPAPQPDRALVVDFRPQRLWTLGPDAHLAFELSVTNTGATAIDAIRPVIVLASAGPDTAADIARFSAGSPTLPGAEPFTLRAGETRSVVGELMLPGDAMYVTTAADRELIVPLALVALHWRAGLSVARATDAFLIGTGDAAAPRLGPIWVDRAGLAYARLDARRFTSGPA